MSRSAQTEPVSSPQETEGGSSPPTERTPPPPAWESMVFRIGVGLIALHIVDDRFVQPEEGVSPADHLVSGIVPLLILAATVLGYGRLRPGWRAICALVLGVLALAVSSEGVYYTAKVGASGDDFTGLLTIPAGLALLSLGGIVLWRSRKREGSLWRIVGRRLLLTVAAILFAFFVLQPIAQVYTVTHVVNAAVPDPGFEASYEDVSFTTADGLTLEGWYVPSENGAAVVVFPGRTDRDEYVDMLANHGYGVLLFDRRGEGDSDGEPNLLGWGGDEDLKAAAAYLEGRPDVEPGRVGGIGLSVGGELLIEAAAESGAFNAVVSDGAGTRSVREVMDRPGRPALMDLWMWSVATAAAAVLTDQMPPPSIQELLPDVSPASLFLIYGEQGQPQEISMNPEFFDAAAEPKQIWEVPEASHISGLDTQPEEYERRVVDFFDAALLDEG